MKTLNRISLTLGSMIAMTSLTTLTACLGNGLMFSSVSKSKPGQISNPTENQYANTATPQELVKVGIRDFGQINESFAVLTAVPSNTQNGAYNPAQNTNYNVRDVYLREASGLPGSNTLGNFKGSHEASAAKIAGEYCQAMFEIANNPKRTAILQGINTGAALSDATIQVLASRLVENLWPDGVSHFPYDEAQEEIIELLRDLRDATPAVSPINSLKASCTALLASLPAKAL